MTVISKLLISVEKTSQSRGLPPLVTKWFYLESDEDANFELIFKTFQDSNPINPDLNGNITLDGKKYHLIKGESSIEQRIYKILPMFDIVRSILKDNIKKILETDYQQMIDKISKLDN